MIYSAGVQCLLNKIQSRFFSKIMIKLSLILTLFAISCFASAITVDSLVLKAMSYHPDIKNIQLQEEIAQKGVDISKSANLPTIDLNLEYDPIKTYVKQSGGFSIVEVDSTHVDLTLNYVLYDFMQTKNKIALSQNSVQIASLIVKESKNALSYKVKKLYDMLVLEQKNIVLEEIDLKLKMELLERAKAFLKGGLKTKADRDSIEASVFEAQNSLQGAKARFEKAKNSLEFLVGENLGDSLVLQDTLESSTLKNLSKDDISKLKLDMLQNNLSLEMAKMVVLGDGENIELQRNKRLPTINLFATYALENNIMNYDAKSFGVKTAISLYDGDKKEQEIQKSQIQKSKSLAELESKKIALLESLTNLAIDVNRLSSTIESKKMVISSAKSVKELVSHRYKEGLSTYIEVLEALSVENMAQKAMLGALFERKDTLHAIDYLTNSNSL